jgi:hypothetical protein
MYGLAYDYGSGYGHHLALRDNGTTYSRFGFAGGAFIGGDLVLGNALYSYIYYDRDNTGYYDNPAGTSRRNYDVTNRIKLVNNVNNEPRWDFSAYVVEAQHWYGNNSSQTMYMGEDSNVINVRGTLRTRYMDDYNDTNFYIDMNGQSRFSRFRVEGAENGWSAIFGPYTLSTNGSTMVYNDNDRYSVQVNAPYYPHLGVSAYANSGNGTHGPVISMTGYLTGGGYRRFMMGIANQNPNEMSFGWFDNQANPHYGVGINWSYPA